MNYMNIESKILVGTLAFFTILFAGVSVLQIANKDYTGATWGIMITVALFLATICLIISEIKNEIIEKLSTKKS
jgi:hypothetical protein